MSKILTLETILSRANSKNPESIKQLNLWGLQVSDISILSKLPLLETISLSMNQIKDISIFKNMKNIKELYLSDNQISDFAQVENLKNCQKLEKLVLKGNPIINEPGYPKKIIEILPQLKILDEKEIKSTKNDNKDFVITKGKAQKISGTGKQITNQITYKNKNTGYKISNSKNDNKDTSAAPEPGAIPPKKINENGNENNNNYGIVDPEIGNPKISAKTLEIFNKSFRKKKTEGTFFKLRKNKNNKIQNQNQININRNDNDLLNNENNNALTTSRIEDDDRFKTLPTSLSFRIFSNDIDSNIKKVGYKKKIIGNYKNGISKLNQSTYLKYQQFDNEDEEDKRKSVSKGKDLNRSFYQRFTAQTYNKKVLDKKDNSFMINNNGNSNKKINENKEKKENKENKEKKDNKENINNSENKENNKKIMESIQLLIGTLSLNGLKEVQSEVQQLLSNMKK
jgi:hypothetical protein